MLLFGCDGQSAARDTTETKRRTHDVLAAGRDDELLDAARDGPEAVRVHVGHVARVQPALGVDRLLLMRAFGVVEGLSRLGGWVVEWVVSFDHHRPINQRLHALVHLGLVLHLHVAHHDVPPVHAELVLLRLLGLDARDL